MEELTDREMLQDLLDLDYGLTDWEVKFVEDIAKQLFDRKEDLTPNQQDKLWEVWEDRCGS